MRSEKIQLSHRGLLEERLRRMQMNLSEYTFAVVYLFRNLHEYELLEGEGIYLKGRTWDKKSYLMPTVPIGEFNWKEVESLLSSVDFLFPIPDEWLVHFNPEKFAWSSNPDDSDYLYQTKKMGHYPGRKLSGRRNLVKQFLEQNPGHRTVAMTRENRADSLQVLEDWYAKHPGEKTDYKECREAVELLEELELEGHLTYNHDEAVGFVYGERLNGETFSVHCAKGLTQVKGIYQYLYEEFAQTLEKSYKWINMEQDLGSAVLRQAKMAYLPDQLLVKWRVNFR